MEVEEELQLLCAGACCTSSFSCASGAWARSRSSAASSASAIGDGSVAYSCAMSGWWSSCDRRLVSVCTEQHTAQPARMPACRGAAFSLPLHSLPGALMRQLGYMHTLSSRVCRRCVARAHLAIEASCQGLSLAALAAVRLLCLRAILVGLKLLSPVPSDLIRPTKGPALPSRAFCSASRLPGFCLCLGQAEKGDLGGE